MVLSAILATTLSLIAANCTGLRGQQLVDCRQSEVDQYGDADAYYNLAIAQEDINAWTAAADSWAEAKRLDPHDPDIAQQHQKCLARVGGGDDQPAQAEGELKRPETPLSKVNCSVFVFC